MNASVQSASNQQIVTKIAQDSRQCVKSIHDNAVIEPVVIMLPLDPYRFESPSLGVMLRE